MEAIGALGKDRSKGLGGMCAGPHWGRAYPILFAVLLQRRAKVGDKCWKKLKSRVLSARRKKEQHGCIMTGTIHLGGKFDTIGELREMVEVVSSVGKRDRNPVPERKDPLWREYCFPHRDEIRPRRQSSGLTEGSGWGARLFTAV